MPKRLYVERKCLFMPASEFNDLLCELYDGEVMLNWTGEKFVAYDTENDTVVDFEPMKKLSEYFGKEVSSVHFDGYEYEGAWVVLK